MLRFVLYGVLLAGLVYLSGADSKAADAFASAASAAVNTQAHAFDFLMGTWTVQNRLLAKRLQHSHEWLRFQSTDCESPLRTGTGNLEYYLSSHWPDFVGMGLRLYDPQTRKWTIYWSDNRFSRGVLQPPVIGDFHDGRGLFEGPDHLNGVPIMVRYIWRSTDHDHAHWSQAFSRDKGRSWEVNWIMNLTRIPENVNASPLSCALHPAHR
jgi:hypothetical protein